MLVVSAVLPPERVEWNGAFTSSSVRVGFFDAGPRCVPPTWQHNRSAGRSMALDDIIERTEPVDEENGSRARNERGRHDEQQTRWHYRGWETVNGIVIGLK